MAATRARVAVTAGLGLLAAGVALALIAGDGSARHARPAGRSVRAAGVPVATATAAAPAPRARGARSGQAAVAVWTVRLVDRSRRIALPGRAPRPRALVTYVMHPATGGPYPLVIFGHGFAVTPAPYARLTRAWARAGYVVAAPVFPLENAHAPGGPDESDLVNQPRDMSFVISRLVAASAARGGPLSGLVDPRRIAVAGHSDGGETALAAAYDRRFLDGRIRAAVILSGAKIPGTGVLTFGSGSPPLLATQGTADTINPPSFTSAFYAGAGRPKYLLRLLGAAHEPPYTNGEPQLGIVERVTIAFLDRYLKGSTEAARRLAAAGNVRGLATLSVSP